VSGFMEWDQKEHAEDYLIYPKNIGYYLSLDETSLSKGEIYTYLTNKLGKGKKCTLIASIKGTRSVDIIKTINKIPLEQRKKVKEVTLDMASNMESAARMSFPNAMITTDHFHVIRLVMDALQHVRIKHRWNALEQENKAIKEAKETNKRHKPIVFKNGDSPKQLLARSRFILAKREEQWTVNQSNRAIILFRNYPDIEKAYRLVIAFRNSYNSSTKAQAHYRFNNWFKEAEELKILEFNTAVNTIRNKIETILNYFVSRNTNANAESFNAKIKLFRANLRGVKDTKFFLYRLEKLFA